MKITVTNKGRFIDFQDGKLPDGRLIKDVLDENISFKKQISKLELDVEKQSSIISKIIPHKRIRDTVEIILFIFGILGIIMFTFQLF